MTIENLRTKYEFNEDQYLAAVQIADFFEGVTNGMFLLNGAAGTGKTYLVSKLIQYLLVKDQQVAFCGPTNKSVKILRHACGINNKKLQYSTIHSILGLRENIDGFGKQTFTRIPGTKCNLESYRYLVLDEASMLDDSIFKMLLDYVQGYGLKILFVGDAAQIPPVNHSSSIPFDKQAQLKYKIKTANLNTIVRQNEGNPIIDFAHFIRSRVDEHVYISHDIKDLLTDKGNVTFIRNKNDENLEKVAELLSQYFNTNKFKDDSDHAKVLGWTNESVNKYNEIIRLIAYGDINSKITKGEKLIMNKPIIDKKSKVTLLNTNDEVEVVKYTINDEYVNFKGNKLTVYNATVEYNSFFGAKFETKLKIIHESSQNRYDEFINLLRKDALREKQGSFNAIKKWKEYYHFQSQFADVNYNYCITCHKSQGSTYDNAIVLWNDIQQNRKQKEMNQILYTACTRPRNNLYIIM